MKKLIPIIAITISMLFVSCGEIDLNTEIYNDQYITVVLHQIHSDELVCSVENKTDNTDITVAISDLYLDGKRYHGSESCDEILAGETNNDGTFYYLTDANLNTEATTISGKVQYIDAGDIFDDQPKFKMKETTINREQ